MCLAIPAKIVEVEGNTAKVELGGVTREVGLQLIHEPSVGEYVLVHAGFAIEKMNPREAQETLQWLQRAFKVEDRNEVRP